MMVLAGTMERIYRSIDIARACDIHVNTLRFYERIGLISEVPRGENNYRRFDVGHLFQVRVIRLLYDGEWPGRPIRRQALRIIEALREWNLPGAEGALRRYRRIIEMERENAVASSELLHDWNGSDDRHGKDDRREYSVREVAGMVSVTTESIRNWERNGLLSIPRRGPNDRRYLTERELGRLRIIAVLRKSGHSLAVIHRALYRLRKEGVKEAVETFRDPGELELLSAGDHYLEVLQRIDENASAVAEVLAEARTIRRP